MADTFSLGFVSTSARMPRMPNASQQTQSLKTSNRSTQMEYAQRQQLLNATTTAASRPMVPAFTGASNTAGTVINNKKTMASGTQSLLAKGVTQSDVLVKRVEYIETAVKNIKDQLAALDAKHCQVTDALVTQQSLNIEQHDTENLRAQVEYVYESMQTVYGAIVRSAPVLMIEENSDVDEVLKISAISKSAVEKWDVMKTGKHVLLVYPMKMIEVDDGSHFVFMKYKSVDEETAQVTLGWVALRHISTDGTSTAFVGNFSLFPSTSTTVVSAQNDASAQAAEESTILVE